MKLAVQILAFREENRIKPCIEQYYDIADDILVAVSQRPWKGNLEPDNTLKIAQTTEAKVFAGEWETEALQRNFTLTQTDADFILISPPDRFYTKEDLQNIRLFVDGSAQKQIYGLYSLNYWKNFNTVLWPTYDLPAGLFPRIKFDGNPQWFSYANLLEDQSTHNPFVPGVLSHHISWIKTDKEMREKIASYTHADEILKDWYEKCWLGWHEGMTNFGPTKAEDFQGTMKYNLPEEILTRFDPKWVKEIEK